MSKILVSTSGFKELDKALGELPKATAKSVLRNTLRKAGEPIAAEARSLAPVGQDRIISKRRKDGSVSRKEHKGGTLRDSIQVSTRVRNNTGKSEFAAAMRAGLGKGAARQALRDARRAAGYGGFVEMYVGPKSLPYAHMVEFGSVNNQSKPYMRPAWDQNKHKSLSIIRAELGKEIIAAARRIGKSKKHAIDVKYRASMAALMAHELSE